MVDGILSEAEGKRLSQIAEKAEHPIVNIGTYLGRSTSFIASSTKQTVYAIVLWDLRHYGFEPDQFDLMHGYHLKKTRKAFLRNIQELGLSNVVPVQGDSCQIGKIWNIPLGMVFIDGNHYYDYAYCDYVSYSKHLVGGGYLVVHDIVIKTVAKLIKEVIEPSGLWTDIQVTDTTWEARKI